MRAAITIEARMTSSRLAGKVMAECHGAPIMARMIERLKRVRRADDIILCVTANAADDPLERLARELDVRCWRGDEKDVLGRVLEGARAFGADVIVETTGDCPLIDPAIIDHVIAAYLAAPVDYCANTLTRGYPIGMDVQVFRAKVLADAARRTDAPADREHVSLFIYKNPALYTLRSVLSPPEHTAPDLRLTLDEPEDLALICALYGALRPKNPAFALGDILAHLRADPTLARINAHVAHRWV